MESPNRIRYHDTHEQLSRDQEGEEDPAEPLVRVFALPLM
jgi:hypothetical protein